MPIFNNATLIEQSPNSPFSFFTNNSSLSVCPAQLGVGSSVPKQQARKKVEHKLTLKDVKALIKAEPDAINKLEKLTTYVLASQDKESLKLFDQVLRTVFDKIIHEKKSLSTVTEKFQEIIISSEAKEASLVLENLVDYYYQLESALQNVILTDELVRFSSPYADFHMEYLHYLHNHHPTKNKFPFENFLTSLIYEYKEKIYTELRALAKEGEWTRDVLYHLFVKGTLKIHFIVGASTSFSLVDNNVQLLLADIVNLSSGQIRNLLREEILGHANKFFIQRSRQERKDGWVHYSTKKILSLVDYHTEISDSQREEYISPCNAFYPLTEDKKIQYRNIMEKDIEFLEKIERSLKDSSVMLSEEETEQYQVMVEALTKYYNPSYTFIFVSPEEIDVYRQVLAHGGKTQLAYVSPLTNTKIYPHIKVEKVLNLNEGVGESARYGAYYSHQQSKDSKLIFLNFMAELWSKAEETINYYPEVPSIGRATETSQPSYGPISQAITIFRHRRLTEFASKLSSYHEKIRDLFFPHITAYDKQEFNEALNTKPYKHFLAEANANLIKTSSCTIL